MGFMDNYEPVSDRIAKFWDKYPNGRIHTEIKLINELEIVIMASVFTDREDMRPAAIDFAQETRGSSNINKTSFIENCSTSAIGRSLAALGFQTKKDVNFVPTYVQEGEKPPLSFTDATLKEFEGRASVLALSSDLDGLRELYSEAKAEGLPNTLLDQIADMAKELSRKTKQKSG